MVISGPVSTSWTIGSRTSRRTMSSSARSISVGVLAGAPGAGLDEDLARQLRADAGSGGIHDRGTRMPAAPNASPLRCLSIVVSMNAGVEIATRQPAASKRAACAGEDRQVRVDGRDEQSDPVPRDRVASRSST